MPNSSSTNPYLNITHLDLAYAVDRLVQLGKTDEGQVVALGRSPEGIQERAEGREDHEARARGEPEDGRRSQAPREIPRPPSAIEP